MFSIFGLAVAPHRQFRWGYRFSFSATSATASARSAHNWKLVWILKTTPSQHSTHTHTNTHAAHSTLPSILIKTYRENWFLTDDDDNHADCMVMAMATLNVTGIGHAGCHWFTQNTKIERININGMPSASGRLSVRSPLEYNRYINGRVKIYQNNYRVRVLPLNRPYVDLVKWASLMWRMRAYDWTFSPFIYGDTFQPLSHGRYSVDGISSHAQKLLEELHRLFVVCVDARSVDKYHIFRTATATMRLTNNIGERASSTNFSNIDIMTSAFRAKWPLLFPRNYK